MQEERVNAVPTTIESGLLFVRDQLSLAEASIRYAQLELGAHIRAIQKVSMQKDTQLCKCTENLSEGQTYLYGERPKKDYQLTQDRVKIAEDFWRSCKLKE